MPNSARNASRAVQQASRSQRGIGAYSTQRLFFRLLPKLDVVGSSPIARSLEVREFEDVPVAGIRVGPGDFFTGPIAGPIHGLIFAANSAFCSSVSATTSASRIDRELRSRIRTVAVGGVRRGVRGLGTEAERTPYLRRFRPELVGLAVLMDLFPGRGALPSAEAAETRSSVGTYRTQHSPPARDLVNRAAKITHRRPVIRKHVVSLCRLDGHRTRW